MKAKTEFSKLLLKNYNPNDRPMPWKGIKNPYLIWLSEIILQQTRVEQGWDYYLKFKSRFPKIGDLADASEDEVLKLWEGLGYYSRARNLLKAAQYVQEELNGIFPDNYKDLLKMKGVGPYTAAAIASFAFNEKKAVLDGNVFRVLSRVFGIKTPIDSAKGKKEFEKLANEVISKNQPGLYNQAIMDLGAVTCTPQNPNCVKCALKSICHAFDKNTVEEFPVKEKKIKKKNRFFHYILLKNQSGNTLIRRRDAGDIWEGLYEFPCIELSESKGVKELQLDKTLQKWVKNNSAKDIKLLSQRTHILTHQKINAQLFELKIEKLPTIEKYQEVSINNLNNFAFPRLINLLLGN